MAAEVCFVKQYLCRMYSKQEVSKLKETFWTTFGRYMKPVLSAEGAVISWSNYKTGIPGISFKMDADNRQASIAIVITQKHAAIFDQFQSLRSMLSAALGEDDWHWEPITTDEYGRTVSRIRKLQEEVSVLRTEDWPAIISFLKPRIIALDEFWSMVKYGFEDM